MPSRSAVLTGYGLLLEAALWIGSTHGPRRSGLHSTIRRRSQTGLRCPGADADDPGVPLVIAGVALLLPQPRRRVTRIVVALGPGATALLNVGASGTRSSRGSCIRTSPDGAGSSASSRRQRRPYSQPESSAAYVLAQRGRGVPPTPRPPSSPRAT
jgi:hypothetical protein